MRRLSAIVETENMKASPEVNGYQVGFCLSNMSVRRLCELLWMSVKEIYERVLPSCKVQLDL